MSKSNDFTKSLQILELEDRLETVQFVLEPTQPVCRCGRPCKGMEEIE